jgi:hypothetical protein
MADRVTTLVEEAVVQGAPNARLTYAAEEAVVQGSPKAHLTYCAVEILVPPAAAAAAQPINFVIT